jgi:hypothetical protein
MRVSLPCHHPCEFEICTVTVNTTRDLGKTQAHTEDTDTQPCTAIISNGRRRASDGDVHVGLPPMLRRKHLPVLRDRLGQLIVRPSTVGESNKEHSNVVQVRVVELDGDVTTAIVSAESTVTERRRTH